VVSVPSTQTVIGSPPRAWGQRKWAARGAYSEAVHPHGRGDNAVIFIAEIAPVGSPPRAWGQLQRRVPESLVARFTPTGVGTTREFNFGISKVPVHPHGRGDNYRDKKNSARYHGSPPRAWGQLEIHIRLYARRRFTPTGVGTTPRIRRQRRIEAVHPHGRGDNESGHPELAAQQRFTPTGVGTTLCWAYGWRYCSVHPHGRGDNVARPHVGGYLVGSPPRAWGQRPCNASILDHARFTPTGVGTTVGRRDSHPRPSVHPHGRGDNVLTQ